MKITMNTTMKSDNGAYNENDHDNGNENHIEK